MTEDEVTVDADAAAPAMIDLQDDVYHSTPLGWCAHGSRFAPKGDHATIARLLLDAGASPDVYAGDASDEIRAVIDEHRKRAN